MALIRYILIIFLVSYSSLTLVAQVNPKDSTKAADPLVSGKFETGLDKVDKAVIKRKGTRPMPPNPELFQRGEFDSDQIEAPVLEQVEEPKNIGSTWRVLTLGFTATGYVGDLNYDRKASNNISQLSLHPGIDLSFRKDAAKTLLPVFRLGYGKYSAQSLNSDPVSYTFEGEELSILPNTYAESILIYGEVGLRFSPFPKSLRIKPYVEAALGGQSFFPRAQDGILLFRKRSTRAPDELEYGSFMLYFPLSFGMDLQLSTSLNLQIAYTLKSLNTDYLDNIGHLGNKAGNDQLHVIRFGLGFRFEDFKKGRKAYQ